MANKPNIPVGVTIAAVPRGVGLQANGQFTAQSMSATFAWGTEPGSATIVYIAPTQSWTIATGALVLLTMGAHLFYGLCMSDTGNLGSSEGSTRTLIFSDLREFLKWDFALCAFNKPDVILEDGRRIKRYKHVYPADYATLTWTYTNTPLLGWQIIAAILGHKALGLVGGVRGGTIGSPWSWDLTGNGLFPNGLFNYPIYDLDFLNGVRLDAVLGEICNRSGCVVGLGSTPQAPYRLVFTRKGYASESAPAPTFPDDSDNRRNGIALSGHPTNVRVVGERNVYQVMDVPMEADWASGWEDFLIPELFADDIYHRASDPNTGFPYDQTPNDPEQFAGRQLANARALSMTVKEYADLRDSVGLGGQPPPADGDDYRDTRKYAGHFRMDMPAWLYISTLLWRAFKPADEFVFINAAQDGVIMDQPGPALGDPPIPGAAPGLEEGNSIPLQSLDIVDRQVCKIYQDDPTTGTLQFDPTQTQDGNGYAIARGYQVGADLFKGISSAQFNLNFFNETMAVWQHVPFQIDDSGEQVRFIIFEQPIILSNNLVVKINGHCVINAQATLLVPPVVAALVFEAEKFNYWKGTFPNVGRDHVENVGGLNLEVVLGPAGYTEVPYADGASAFIKADAIAEAVLQRQYYYDNGGYRWIWNPATMAIEDFGQALTSMVDRVQIETSPRGGTFEVVDLTNERARDHFEPERELERKTQTNSLFPGQAELRIEAETYKKLAAAFKQSPRIGRDLADLISGAFGSNQPLEDAWIAQPNGTAPLPAGTVLRRAQIITQ